MNDPSSLKHVFLWQVPTFILFFVISVASIVLCSAFLAGICLESAISSLANKRTLKKKAFSTSCSSPKYRHSHDHGMLLSQFDEEAKTIHTVVLLLQ